MLDYISRLRTASGEGHRQVYYIIPRIYTNKPRTTGDGYKGSAPSARPEQQSRICCAGLISHPRTAHEERSAETGLFLRGRDAVSRKHTSTSTDMLAYVAVGARSVENQQHRLTASGLEAACRHEKPDQRRSSRVMLNSITAAQHHAHLRLPRTGRCRRKGNPLLLTRSCAALSNKHGQNHTQLPLRGYQASVRALRKKRP